MGLGANFAFGMTLGSGGGLGAVDGAGGAFGGALALLPALLLPSPFLSCLHGGGARDVGLLEAVEAEEVAPPGT